MSEEKGEDKEGNVYVQQRDLTNDRNKKTMMLRGAIKVLIACAIAGGNMRAAFDNAIQYIKFKVVVDYEALPRITLSAATYRTAVDKVAGGKYDTEAWFEFRTPEFSGSQTMLRWNLKKEPGVFALEALTLEGGKEVPWKEVLRVGMLEGDLAANWDEYEKGSAVNNDSLDAFKKDGRLSAFPCVAWKILSDAMGAFVGDECDARSLEGRMIVDSLNRLADRVRQQVNVRLLRARCIPEDAKDISGSGSDARDAGDDDFIDILDATEQTTFCVLGVIDRQPQQEQRRPQYVDVYDLQMKILLWNQDDKKARSDVNEMLKKLQEDVNKDVDMVSKEGVHTSIYRFRSSLGRLDLTIDDSEEVMAMDFRQEALRLLDAVVMHNRNSSLGVLELMDSLVNGTSVVCRRDDKDAVLDEISKELE